MASSVSSVWGSGRRRRMGHRQVTISPGLWRALVGHAERTREPPAHIVSKALAEYLQLAHHTLYQVSTAAALVEGIYQGAVRVGTLREHGDLGLGTFEGLDGEMVVVDGQFFQVRSDGSVRECDDDVLSPFAVITRFIPEPAVVLEQCPDLSHLTSRLDALRDSDNLFFALRVDGHFDYVHTRDVQDRRGRAVSPSGRSATGIQTARYLGDTRRVLDARVRENVERAGLSPALLIYRPQKWRPSVAMPWS